MKPTLDIIHITAECYPIAKVGGLADVVGALPFYQNKIGHHTSVVMPFYDNKFTQQNEFKNVAAFSISLDDTVYEVTVKKLSDKEQLNFECFFVDIPKLLFTNYVYSENDIDRFLAFSIATLTWLNNQPDFPSVIHCHDHHTGLIPFMMSQCHEFEEFKRIPSILTIHNAQYQGWMSHDHVSKFPEFDFDQVGLLDWNGVINPLAAAIKCAWSVTTVSPNYMEELKYNANGLESLIQSEFQKCTGILNGIDTNVWNPETDSFLVKNYTTSSFTSGKKANKKSICDEFDLDITKPLFAFIGRLVGEKGAELLPDVIENTLSKIDCSILILGSGHAETERALSVLKDRFLKNYNCFIGYDEALSHRIYAGADFLLMPSRVEPCGLNQMYSLRYGTVPIVRQIGGLKDTVIDISENGFGITHLHTEVNDIVNAIERATIFYSQAEKFKENKKRIMQIDHSWDKSAQEYIHLYKLQKHD